jgi:hypothetical protein
MLLGGVLATAVSTSRGSVPNGLQARRQQRVLQQHGDGQRTNAAGDGRN